MNMDDTSANQADAVARRIIAGAIRDGEFTWEEWPLFSESSWLRIDEALERVCVGLEAQADTLDGRRFDSADGRQ
jgi:hypothetical protein